MQHLISPVSMADRITLYFESDTLPVVSTLMRTVATTAFSSLLSFDQYVIQGHERPGLSDPAFHVLSPENRIITFRARNLQLWQIVLTRYGTSQPSCRY